MIIAKCAPLLAARSSANELEAKGGRAHARPGLKPITPGAPRSCAARVAHQDWGPWHPIGLAGRGGRRRRAAKNADIESLVGGEAGARASALACDCLRSHPSLQAAQRSTSGPSYERGLQNAVRPARRALGCPCVGLRN